MGLRSIARGIYCLIDLQKLKMWEPLHGLVGLPSTTDGVRLQTLWVLGTALQNNPSAQFSVSQTNPVLWIDGLPKLTAIFCSSIRPWIPFLSFLYVYHPRPTLQALDRKPCTRCRAY